MRCRRKLDCISVLPSSAVSKTGVKISAGLLCCFIRQLVLMEDNSKEHLVWASLDEDIKMYPEFFKTELKYPADTVKLFTTDKR